MTVTLEQCAELLRDADRILILSHQYPDGDTLGSASGLCRALQKMGKRARCECADEIGPRYRYLYSGVEPDQFDPAFIMSVDVADSKLLGRLESAYAGTIRLAIDHHGSHVPFAEYEYVDSTAAAACEIIPALLGLLGVEIDSQIANSLYTGITTDTGCFRYPNATPATYRTAADLMEKGADAAEINRVMFDTKSRARLEMERLAMDTMEFFEDGRVAMMEISCAMVEKTGALDSDLDGLSAIPRQIEGVLVGVTFRQRSDGGYKVSLRTQPPIDAAAICSHFGGGGHRGAAGCSFTVPLSEAKQQMLEVIRAELAIR